MVFVAGIAVGILTTVWFSGGRDVGRGKSTDSMRFLEQESYPPGAAQAVAPGRSPSAQARRSPDVAVDPRDAVVTVSALDAQGREQSRLAVARLGKTGVLVLPVPALGGAVSLRVRDRFGQEQTVGNVVAFDEDSGLMALAPGSNAGPALEVAPEEHPLYLGREFGLVTSSVVVPGWVDGGVVDRLDSASPLVPVHLSGDGKQSSGVLLSTDGPLVLGILYPGTDHESFRGALQADSLRVLLSRADSGQGMALNDVLDRFFLETPAGMWQELQRRRSAEDWAGVIELGTRLLEDSSRHHGQLVPLLETAVVEQARARLAEGNYTQALRWLARGESLLGDSPAVLAAYASTYMSMGDFDAARGYLMRLSASGSAAADAVRRQLRELVMIQVQTLAQKGAVDELVALLEEMARVEPEHAPYHQHLGQAYLRQRDYARALQHLSRAVQLDSKLAGSLDPSILQAQVKLSVPELTEVAYTRSSGGIRVDVRLNGSPEVYRFVLDTGASQTVVVRPVAERLGIETGGATPRVRVRTASDEVVAPLVTLESVDLGGAVVPRVKALIMDDLGGPDGLLGLSYLSYFDVAIEQDAGILSLRRK